MSKESPKDTPIQQHEVTPATDPSKVKLPPGFTVCVLGASRGIGAAVAYAYAQAGASTIVIAARSVGSLESVAAKCKDIQPTIKVHCEYCDITQNDSVAALAQRIADVTQQLDVVVVNSGFSGPVVLKVTEGDPADWKSCFDINTLGTYLAAHHLLPILLRSEGARSFLVVSTAGVTITEGPIANPGYCISKLAQLRLVEMIAKQYEDQELLAVGIHPGAVATEMSKDAPEVFKKCKQLTALMPTRVYVLTALRPY